MNSENLKRANDLTYQIAILHRCKEQAKEIVSIHIGNSSSLRYSLGLYSPETCEQKPELDTAVCTIEDVTQTLIVKLLDSEIDKLTKEFEEL